MISSRNWQQGKGGIEQGLDAFAMNGAHREDFVEAELGKFHRLDLDAMGVHLVHCDKDRFAAVTEARGGFTVEWHDAFLDVHHEDDDIGGFNRDLDLFEGGANDDVVGLFAPEQTDAAGIHEGEGLATPFCLGGNAIAGDARLIVNNSDAPSNDAVKERRFPDVRPTDNGD